MTERGNAGVLEKKKLALLCTANNEKLWRTISTSILKRHITKKKRYMGILYANL